MLNHSCSSTHCSWKIQSSR